MKLDQWQLVVKIMKLLKTKLYLRKYRVFYEMDPAIYINEIHLNLGGILYKKNQRQLLKNKKATKNCDE